MSTIITAVYGGGPFYSGGDPVIADLKASGFTTVIAWAVHVNANGDLNFNSTPIVSNGSYIGSAAWPGQLASLKQGTTSVNRLLFSIGGWGVQDFANIQALINSQGTGPSSILYQNFQALKSAIPAIDGIDYDDEEFPYDQSSLLSFSLMLQTIGYSQVTFCPYTESAFWVALLSAVDSQAPGFVTGFNLQCYAGGTGNSPQDWINAIQQQMGPGFPAASFVYPGLWCRHGQSCNEGLCPDEVAAAFAHWQSTGILGGFIWLYDDILSCVKSRTCSGPMDSAAYAAAIVQGLQ